MNASVFRNTRFEIRQLHQGPNAFGLLCSERGVAGSSPPPLQVDESEFTDEEMAQVHAVLEMLENKFAAVFDRETADITPQKVQKMLAEVQEAKAQKEALLLAAAQIEAENAAKRAEAAELDKAIADMKAASALASETP